MAALGPKPAGVKTFPFFFTTDVTHVNVRVRPLKFAASSRIRRAAAHIGASVVEAQLWADGRPLGLALRTACGTETETGELTWTQWLEFPVRYADLPLSAVVVLTVWAVAGPDAFVPLGSGTLALFQDNRLLVKGKHALVLEEAALASPLPDAAAGSSDVPQLELAPATPAPGSAEARRIRIERGVRLYDRGELPKFPWLDALSFARIDEESAAAARAGLGSEKSVLVVQFVSFDHPVVATPEEDMVELVGGDLPPWPRLSAMIQFSDPGVVGSDVNPVEAKHRRLARSHRKGFLDVNLKPNASERRELNAVITAPPTAPISDTHSELLWKFRYSLIANPRALGVFLRTIEWDDESEVDVVCALLPSWARVSVEQALELLLYSHPAPRQLAIDVLADAPDAQILAFLLQLVQCLRYSPVPGPDSPLGAFLLARALGCDTLGNFLVWYLQVECEDKVHGVMFHNFIVAYESAASAVEARVRGSEDPSESAASSLAHSAAGLFSTAISFVTGESATDDAALPTSRVEIVARQRNLLANLNALYSELRKHHNRKKNISRLQAGLGHNGEFSHLASFPPVSLPVAPHVLVNGLVAPECTLLKSALTPLLLTFSDVDGGTFKVLYKAGDDPRQDQLVIQLIQLMDSLLLKEALDLKLLPYSVLAASSHDGLIEFVDKSYNVSRVIKEHKAGILGFFRKLAPDPDAPHGVADAMLDTYARSCAGYCVITYILAVGDRHLDNLLICETGQLFHIDFGYILGKDPKPLPPPMKLSKEMVEALGGSGSEHYSRFISYCCESFNILRKSAHLILNLLRLMIDANIPDLSSQPDRALRRVQDNFRLDLTDEEAIQYFQHLIHDSVTALAPQIAETFHRVAAYWKS